MKNCSYNITLKIFKTRGLSVGGCKKASGRAFFINRLTTPEMVETYKNVSTVESPLLVNNWRPRPPFFTSLTNFIFYIYCCMGFCPCRFNGTQRPYKGFFNCPLYIVSTQTTHKEKTGSIPETLVVLKCR